MLSPVVVEAAGAVEAEAATPVAEAVEAVEAGVATPVAEAVILVVGPLRAAAFHPAPDNTDREAPEVRRPPRPERPAGRRPLRPIPRTGRRLHSRLPQIGRRPSRAGSRLRPRIRHSASKPIPRVNSSGSKLRSNTMKKRMITMMIITGTMAKLPPLRLAQQLWERWAVMRQANRHPRRRRLPLRLPSMRHRHRVPGGCHALPTPLLLKA
jgi:hypothetical protein